MYPSKKNILLCLRYGIGDVVMELAAIKALREKNPEIHIIGMGAEPAIQLPGSDLLDERVPVNQWGIKHWYDCGDRQIEQAVRTWVNQQNFSVIYDACNAPALVREILYESGARIYDCDDSVQQAVLSDGGEAVCAVTKGIQKGWQLSQVDDDVPDLELLQSEFDSADDWLEHNSVKSHIIGISAGASSPLKAWPVNMFIEVVQEFQSKGFSFILFTDTLNEQMCEWVCRQTGPKVNIAVAGGLSLRLVAALLARCDAYLGNDSGLMHLAAAMKTPVVGIFGPTDPDIYLPRWVRSCAVSTPVKCGYVRKGVFGHSHCVLEGACLTGQQCIVQIDSGEVIKSLEQVLDANGPKVGREGCEVVNR